MQFPFSMDFKRRHSTISYIACVEKQHEVTYSWQTVKLDERGCKIWESKYSACAMLKKLGKNKTVTRGLIKFF